MPKKKTYLLLLLAYAFVIFFNSGKQALLADEPIRALGALEMEISGSAIPTLNGEVYTNKPPLYNWILLGFFKVTGSHSEFVVRLPALLSLLLFGFLIYYFFKKLGSSEDLAFWTAFATLCGGNLLFYSSLLGHIDALYASVVFSQIALLILHAKAGKWSHFFLVSALLTFIGFMLKGLPSFVFQGISVLVILQHYKAWKKLWTASFPGAAILLLSLVSLYLWYYSGFVQIDDYVGNLWNESSKRTAIEKDLWQSVKHILLFPLQYVLDTAPYSLLIGLWFLPSVRKAMLKTDQNKLLLKLFLFNIIIYWLSPDNRTRYIFMLQPILFYLLFSMAYDYFSDHGTMFRRGLWITAVLVLSARLTFDLIVIPQRATELSSANEAKQEANAITDITRDQPLAMYYSNLHYDMTWYITLNRMEIVPIKDEDDSFSTDEYYISPMDLVYPDVESERYHTFVRNYGRKKFTLVKYKQLPPPLSNDGKYDLSGYPGDE